MEFRQEAGVGAVSVPNIVTCLSPWGQTGAIPSTLGALATPLRGFQALTGRRRSGGGLASG
jgi:hypothetical protein